MTIKYTENRDPETNQIIDRIGYCPCGANVFLVAGGSFNFTTTCNCGKDYNSSGDELAPREQWGEETGEHWSDCY